MAGIERIDIASANLGYTGEAGRFWQAKRHWVYANRLYRSIFEQMGVRLDAGNQVTRCSRDDFLGGYDHDLGIDAFFHFANGMTGTLQEKYLEYLHGTTATVEYMQDPQNEEHGDWFNIKAQFYFVGYDCLHIQCPTKRDTIEHEIQTGECSTCGKPFDFQSWILLNWPAVILETNKGNIDWMAQENQGHARANFQYADFTAFPSNCVIAKHEMANRKEWTVRELNRRREERLG